MRPIKFVLLTALVAVVTFSACSHKEYETVKGDTTQTRIYTLDNGLKVYLSVNDEKPRITAHIAVNTGHRNDPAETTGLAHYLEHIMFKGTTHFGTTDYEAERPLLEKITELYEEYRVLTDPEERRAKYHEIDSVSQLAAQYNIPNEYDKLMANIGGSGSNAYTSFDVTCYTEDIPNNELENWAKIQSDRFKNMVIRGFHTELETVYEEKNISLTNDGEKLIDALFAKLFPSHSYGTQTTIGTQEHLKNPSIINIQNYFKRYYAPNNVAICMSGDLDPDKTIAMIKQYFGDWQPSADPSGRVFDAQPVFTAPQDTAVVGQEQELIAMGWRFNGAADVQCDTLSLIGNILSNGKAGLFDLDLNQKMKVLGAASGVYELKDYSVLILQGVPNPGQTLDEVKSLMLEEISKLKNGDFDDDMLTAILNNQKLRHNQQLESSRGLVGMYVDAFINGEDWAAAINKLDRMSKISKQDIIDFAQKHLTDGYACVKKLQGEDTSIKKIEKPAITPIPSNRDYVSKFLEEIAASEVAPIEPKFVNYETDLVKAETTNKLPLLYKKNETNNLFTLNYLYEFGQSADNRFDIATEYIDLLGTDTQSAEELKKQFYKLACNYSISVRAEEMTVSLSGLSENMEEAVKLLDNFMQHVQPDVVAYQLYIDQVEKMRIEAKNSQSSCFSALREYAMYGPRNSFTDAMSISQLKETDPAVFTDLIKSLKSMKHQVIYYGPMSVAEVDAVVSSVYDADQEFADIPVNRPYELQQTPANEVVLAPYDANNIYMQMVHNEGRQWNAAEATTKALFNEYFGGGMNTIVFQELREARGLAYSARAYYMNPTKKENPEYAMTYIISQNDKLMDCINTFNEIINEIPQSEGSFELAKQSLFKNIASARTTKVGVINSYLAAQRMGLNYDINKTIYEELNGTTLQDVVAFEQQTMANKPYRYIVLGNEKELNMTELGKIGPIKRLTLTDIFGY